MAGVEIKLSVNSKEAEGQIKKFVDGTTGAFETLKHVAEVAVAAFALEKVVEGFKSAVNVASEYERALTSMNVALRLSGHYSAESSAGFSELAENLSRTTQYTEDQSLKAITLAESFNLSNDQTERLVRASADLAAVTDGDLNGAITKLGATLTGNIGKLGRSVPELKRFTQSQLEAGAGIGAVADRYRGFSEALGQTFSGSLQIAGHAFEDFQKSIGQLITDNPVVQRIIQGFSQLFFNLSDAIKQNSVSIGNFISRGLSALVAGVPIAISVLQGFLEILGGIVKVSALAVLGVLNIVQIFTSFDAVNETLSFFVKVIALATSTLVDLIKAASQLPGVKDVLGAAGVDVDKLGDSFDGVNKKLFEFTDTISGDKIKGAVDKAFEVSANATDSVDQAFEAVHAGLEIGKSKAQEFGDAIANAAAKGTQGFRDMSKSIESAADKFEGLGKEDRLKFFQKFEKNPFDFAFGNETQKGAQSGDFLAGGVGALFQGIGKGAAGGADIVSKLIEAFADSLVPGLGPIAGQIISVLAQGPDKVKELVDSFLQSLPTIIVNIVKSIPVILDEIAAQLPDVITKIADGLSDAMPGVATHLAAQAPFIGTRMAIEMVKNIPHIVEEFTKEFIKIPGKFLDELVKGLKDALKGLGNAVNPFSGGGLVGAAGGAIIGGAVLGPIGEAAGAIFGGGGLFRTDINQLQPTQSQGSANIRTSGGSSNQTVVVKLQIGEKELASTILQMTQRGFRLA